MARKYSAWNPRPAAPREEFDAAAKFAEYRLLRAACADKEFIKQYCRPLCSPNSVLRKVALNKIEANIRNWVVGYGWLDVRSMPVENEAIFEIVIKEGGDVVLNERTIDNPLAVLLNNLPGILRISMACPFPDVRERYSMILRFVKEKGLRLPIAKVDGPSKFIPNDKIPSMDSFEEKAHMLFIDTFFQSNRLDHVTQVMGFHPMYLEIFMKTQNFIMRGDGPLSFDKRHMIAIMAAGRHKCNYLINLQKQEFLLQGGDINWMKGLQAIPQKLRDLYEINKILAHRPWLLGKKHIEKLTRNTPNPWSMAEITHAIVILVHFHALSSFVFGCGVNQEIDHETGHYFQVKSDMTYPKSSLASTSKSLVNPSGSDKKDAKSVSSPEVTKQMKKKKVRFADECGQEEVNHFIEDGDFLYQDFARREDTDIRVFRIQDYSWNDQGYSLMSQLYSDVGALLDDKFRITYNLTYSTMGERKDVDTSSFRLAVWNYTQFMFGIRYDDYDYDEIKQLLQRSLKAFIKTTCCYPEMVTKSDYDGVLTEFEHSEKVHVNLMVLEARLQAELLYALRALNSYMT